MNTCFTIEYKNVHYILKHNHLLDAKETMCLLILYSANSCNNVYYIRLPSVMHQIKLRFFFDAYITCSIGLIHQFMVASKREFVFC